MRRDPRDIMREACLTEDLKRPQMLYKCVGHPRQNWIDDNLERAYRKLHNEQWDPNDPIKIANFIDDAHNRKF